VKGLNISRIILFAVILLVLHVLNELFIPSVEEYEEPDARTFWLVTGYFVQAVIVIAIFARLAKIQTWLLYVHVVCVFILCELLGFAILFALGEDPMATPFIVAIFDYSVLAVWAVIGTEIGRRLRVAAEKKAEITSN
jgi:Mn2+/Fe2+ NRAMP family transporter